MSDHPVEYKSALHRIEALRHVTTWVRVEEQMLSERNQTHIVQFHLDETPSVGKSGVGRPIRGGQGLGPGHRTDH